MAYVRVHLLGKVRFACDAASSLVESPQLDSRHRGIIVGWYHCGALTLYLEKSEEYSSSSLSKEFSYK